MYIADAVGAHWFEEVREVRLVKVLSQSDEPPGRDPKTLQYTTLAKSTKRVTVTTLQDAIAKASK